MLVLNCCRQRRECHQRCHYQRLCANALQRRRPQAATRRVQTAPTATSRRRQRWRPDEDSHRRPEAPLAVNPPRLAASTTIDGGVLAKVATVVYSDEMPAELVTRR